MKFDFAAKVVIGTKPTNDDRLLIAGEILNESELSGSLDLPAVVAVCDGCGGYAGGGIAASTVLELLSYEKPDELADTDYLAAVLNNCKQAVFERKSEMPEFSAMCTTVAGCVFLEDSMVIFHSGDSRVYRNDEWCIAKMTRDHSIVQEMLDMGEITPDEAKNHPKRNVISRCIGIEGPAPEIYASNASINPGEKYLLCSDGLWESVSDDEIRGILGSELSLTQMAEVLIQKALKQGADDNISVLICAAQGDVNETESTPFILD